MTETAASIKATTAKQANSSFAIPDYGIPKLEMPKFGLPNMEIPEAFREMAQKGVAQAVDTNAKAKAASEAAANLLERTYTTAAKGAANYNLKIIEIARTNTRAAFDYAHKLLGVKSASEFIELLTAQMRRQFDIVYAQNKALRTLANEMVAEDLISRGSG